MILKVGLFGRSSSLCKKVKLKKLEIGGCRSLLNMTGQRPGNVWGVLVNRVKRNLIVGGRGELGLIRTDDVRYGG